MTMTRALQVPSGHRDSAPGAGRDRLTLGVLAAPVGSDAVLVAGVVILVAGWNAADPISRVED